jgi:2-oxo-hept-3-ene-1,7-dioate hydratase
MTDATSQLVPVLAPDEHTRIARELRQSTRQGVQLEQLSRRHPGLTVGDSYAIQRCWAALRLSGGWFSIDYALGLAWRPRN